ncbi:hypothetical protein Tco_0523820 [Tanacetum coccineum]
MIIKSHAFNSNTLSCKSFSYDDIINFFHHDFENEFPAIVYNDAQKSKPDLFTKPILNLQRIDEFNLNDKTSLSEYDEKEQNVLYFNDLFPFNIVCSDDSKAEKHDDSNDIDIIQPFEDNEISHGSNTLFETSHDKKTKDFRTESFVINLNENIVIWIYYANGMLFYLIKNLCAPFRIPFDPKRYYKDGVCAIMLRRPRSIRHMAPLPPCEQRYRFLRYEGLEYTDSDISDFESRLERIHMREIHRVPILNFGGLPDLMSEGLTARLTIEHRDEADIPNKGDLEWEDVARSKFLTGWLRDGRYTWAWEALGPKRQPDVAASAPAEVEDASIIDEGGQADSAPAQAPQQPPPPPPAPARTMVQRLGRLEEDVKGLRQDFRSLRGLVERSMTDQGQFSTWMMTCMTQLMKANGLTYQAFDRSIRGSSSAAFQRRTRQRTGEASSSAAQ